MEMVIAIIASLLLGGGIGYVILRLKNQSLFATIEQLKWQLEREQTNAKMQVENLQTQLEKTKTDFEERIAQVKADSKELLATQERNHEQALKAQQARFDETMAKVSAQVKIATTTC